MKNHPLMAQGQPAPAADYSFFERVLNALFGEPCPYCHSRGIVRGHHWSRGTSHLCKQAAGGDWGGYCPHCHEVSFSDTDEEWEKRQPEWVSLPGGDWHAERPKGQQRVPGLSYQARKANHLRWKQEHLRD